MLLKEYAYQALVMNLQIQSEQIVLLWLATSNNLGEPNVPPKELFLFKGRNKLIIANIASPKSLMNILENPNVCVTGIDIWKQKEINFLVFSLYQILVYWLYFLRDLIHYS